MTIASEIARLQAAKVDIMAALVEKGVDVTGKNLVDVPDLIDSIEDSHIMFLTNFENFDDGSLIDYPKIGQPVQWTKSRNTVTKSSITVDGVVYPCLFVDQGLLYTDLIPNYDLYTIEFKVYKSSSQGLGCGIVLYGIDTNALIFPFWNCYRSDRNFGVQYFSANPTKTYNGLSSPYSNYWNSNWFVNGGIANIVYCGVTIDKINNAIKLFAYGKKFIEYPLNSFSSRIQIYGDSGRTGSNFNILELKVTTKDLFETMTEP